MNNELTIVIPCKNEGLLVIETIKLLLLQRGEYRIVVADSSDDEGSQLLLRKYARLHSDRITLVEGGLPSVARNRGFELVDTPYVLFLDADVHIRQNDLIVKCLEKIAIGGYDLLTCRFRTIDGDFDWVYRIFNIVQWLSSKTMPFALGGFMLFRVDTFNKIGRFNEGDKIAEDYHISSKIRPSKFKVEDLYVYTPSRRFKKKGLGYMIRLMIMCWWNRHNDNFFKRDFNYWS